MHKRVAHHPALADLAAPRLELGLDQRDPFVHQRVCDDAAVWIESKGWRVIGIEPSPITGPEGNVEFLLGAIRED